MTERLIIITTGLCRPDVHNESFSNIFSVFTPAQI